ncbi:DUF2236 domain-containing protein [Tsukamurella asaccharolytica]|uniref:DUF2236 domain-containing protein n=1 Tax=Tsukamurella asaccharolytica TaxID=2592067 RepID=A0A5C5R9W9_9ACTN|nr:DUF2236 domain-containing protein [Tsukamurella asaccharolytica]
MMTEGNTMDLLAGALGKGGKRALRIANSPRVDAGYFGPGSVSWRIWGHPVTAVSGIRGSIVAVFDPAGAAGVDQHSTYASDPLGRVQRSNMFFLQVVFGDTVAAEKIGQWLFNRHQKVNGLVPDTGEPYVANVPETLLWVYVTGWHGMLECYQRFAPAKDRLDRDEIERFYHESLVTADLLGIPPRYVPANSLEVDDYLREQGSKLIRPTNEMRRLVEFFLHPPLAPAWPLLAINPFLRMTTYAALSTLPDEWLDLIEVERHPRRWAINDAVVKAALNTANSVDLVDSFLVLAGPEAWGYRHNALRRNSFAEPVPYSFKQGEALQLRRVDG